MKDEGGDVEGCKTMQRDALHWEDAQGAAG